MERSSLLIYLFIVFFAYALILTIQMKATEQCRLLSCKRHISKLSVQMIVVKQHFYLSTLQSWLSSRTRLLTFITSYKVTLSLKFVKGHFTPYNMQLHWSLFFPQKILAQTLISVTNIVVSMITYCPYDDNLKINQRKLVTRECTFLFASYFGCVMPKWTLTVPNVRAVKQRKTDKNF